MPATPPRRSVAAVSEPGPLSPGMLSGGIKRITVVVNVGFCLVALLLRSRAGERIGLGDLDVECVWLSRVLLLHALSYQARVCATSRMGQPLLAR